MSQNETRERKSKIWERDPLDWYQEPTMATEALLEVERFVGPVWDPCCGGGNIVMNPPFFRAKGAEAFIRKALSLATGKVCAFVDIRFIAGAERANGLFAEHCPHRIWIITPRVSCPPGEYLAAGHKAGNGSSDWCWLVWDLTAPKVRTSQTGWLRRGRG